MKAINEAYLILKDPIARARYDTSYHAFQVEKTSSKQNTTNHEQELYYKDYNISDAVLKTWMERARKQAATLVKQTIEDFRGMANAGAKGIVKGAGEQFIAQIIISLLFLLCLGLAKACN